MRDAAWLLGQLRGKGPRQQVRTLRRLRLTTDERLALLDLVGRGPHRTIPGARRLRADTHEALEQLLEREP